MLIKNAKSNRFSQRRLLSVPAWYRPVMLHSKIRLSHGAVRPMRRKPSRSVRQSVRCVGNLPGTFGGPSDASETFPERPAARPMRRKPSRSVRQSVRCVGNLPGTSGSPSDASETFPERPAVRPTRRKPSRSVRRPVRHVGIRTVCGCAPVCAPLRTDSSRATARVAPAVHGFHSYFIFHDL
jgi:hypothetical protein